ncbi:MAG: hypothetical protein KKE20_07105 [Nanoarchaeota archaeon]|nr:hypothetical protein [Nanoarchaeota archaeon]
MKRLAIIIGILAIALLVACQPQTKGPAQTAPSDDMPSSDKVDEAPGIADDSDSMDDSGSDITDESDDSMMDGSDKGSMDTGASDPGISDSELDELEKDLQGMEFDDLDSIE